jgi:hypothetical protein
MDRAGNVRSAACAVRRETGQSAAITREGAGDMTIRKSVIAGLTLSAAVMCFAGQPRAYPSRVRCIAADAGVTGGSSGRDQCPRGANNRGFGRRSIQKAYNDPAKGLVIELASLKASRSLKPLRNRSKEPSRVVGPQSQTIPPHPVIRDCIHVFFPQCSPPGSLYGGMYPFPE